MVVTQAPQNVIAGGEVPSRWRLRATILVATIALLVALPTHASATTLELMPVERAAQAASTVFVGTVVGMQAERSADGVRTSVRLWVDESLKGNATGIVTVYVPGGCVSQAESATVDGMASFSPGEQCVVFADKRGWVIGGYQGKVHLGTAGLEDDPDTREAVTGRILSALSIPRPAADSTTPSPALSLAVSGPRIASVSPGSASAGTGSTVAIRGSGFGATPGKVEFSLNVYGVARLKSEDIDSWSDTLIECAVPVDRVGGSLVSAGNGPLVVTTQGGSQSNPYEFVVPFGYAGVKWETPRVTYRVNPGTRDVAKREALVDAGAVPWSSARSAYSFVDGGLSSATAKQDGQNVICWSDTIPEGVVAITHVYTDGTGHIVECDMEYNQAQTWGDGVAPGTRDVQTIATHEMGHWLCLLDQYSPGDAEKVMYGFEVPGQRRQLTLGEVSGIRWIYPAPSGALHGVVHDAKGSPLAGATIAVDTCEKVLSRSDGTFDVPNIPAGDYQFACSLAGYTTRVQPVTVVANQTSESEVTLNTGIRVPVYRFYQRQNGSHFYTASVPERDAVIAKLGDVYTFEGIAYFLNRIDPVNSSPLFRFYNKRTGSHFYTANRAERDRVISGLSDTYSFDGVAYYVSASPARAANQVFRFYNKRNGSHFYTASTAEKFIVIRDLNATYAYEGTAFWVAP